MLFQRTFIIIRGNPKMNCTPKVRHKTYGVQFILSLVILFYIQCMSFRMTSKLMSIY